MAAAEKIHGLTIVAHVERRQAVDVDLKPCHNDDIEHDARNDKMLQSEMKNQSNYAQEHECSSVTSSTLPSGHAPPVASSSQGSANRKTRITLACKRCKRRKQRCDGARPSCQACQRAQQACTYERIARPQYPGGKALYISALEERIAFLEARLPDHAHDHFDNTSDETQQVSHTSRRGSYHESHAGSISEDVDFDEGTSLVDGVAYLSLCASGTTDTKHEPYYLGSSSGATIARIIQSSIYRRLSTQPAGVTTPAQVRQVPPSTARHEQVDTLEPPEIADTLPNPVQARMLFDFFFERIHPRWPLLDRAVYEELFDLQYCSGSLSITHRSILHLIYAITARFLAVTKKPCGVDDECQLAAATGPMEHILRQHDLGTVQFLTLLGIHGQRSPYGAGAWSQVRYATSVCIEMGLHRKRRSSGSSEHLRDTEIRRRAFWSCYCLDRVTSIVLGRAFAIADRDINVELPSSDPAFWTLTHRDEGGTHIGQSSNVQPFIHIIKLDKIQSRIHKTVFRVDKDVMGGSPEQQLKLDRKISAIRADLEAWVLNYPRTPKNNNKSTWMYDPENAYLDARDFYSVQYHKAVLFLFTVFLPVLEISDERFNTCAHAAASVCNAYKRLSQNQTLTYTMISLHSCFVAGLTLVYCIWRDRKLFSYEVVEATQSCSQILTIFGEKWPGAVKYRDIFDALSQSLFKLALKPRDGEGNATDQTSIHLNIDKHPLAAEPNIPFMHGSIPPTSPVTSNNKPGMSELVSDAVKDAFMEVDDEAPGGWQGWRMWNEMVTDDNLKTAGTDRTNDELFAVCANPHVGPVAYDIDPVQNATMHFSDGLMFTQDQWDVSGYR